MFSGAVWGGKHDSLFSPGLFIRVPLGGLIDRSDKGKTAPLMLNTRNYLRRTCRN